MKAKLPFDVEVIDRAGVRPIASFDVKRVAERYARDCANANHPALEYRVTEIIDVLEVLDEAEAFVRGFEGDEIQEGIDELLAKLRAAIKQEGAN
jgi:type II restriction/modification system DNA methylase subunit YeeA